MQVTACDVSPTDDRNVNQQLVSSGSQVLMGVYDGRMMNAGRFREELRQGSPRGVMGQIQHEAGSEEGMHCHKRGLCLLLEQCGIYSF